MHDIEEIWFCEVIFGDFLFVDGLCEGEVVVVGVGVDDSVDDAELLI